MNETSISTKQEIRRFLLDRKFDKLFVLSGQNSYVKSDAKKFLDPILKNKKAFVYLKKSYYTEFNELKKINNFMHKFQPNLIVAIGGGSVLDYAKIINVLKFSPNLKEEIKNSSYSFKNKLATLVAIPTTAGSGAEVTANAVIYINKVKYSIEGNLVKPDYFFLVPDFVRKSSNKLKSSAGFDAISQGLESIISIKSNNESINFAKKSLFYSLKYFVPSLQNPNMENISKMCLAANLSGKAISISKTTAPHAVSYPFTAYYGISHGHAVSLTLEKFLKFNFKNINAANTHFNLRKKFEIIFNLTKTKNILELQSYLNKMKKEANLNDNLRQLGIDIHNDYSKIISNVNLQRLKNNPIKIERKDLKKILTSLWK